MIHRFVQDKRIRILIFAVVCGLLLYGSPQAAARDYVVVVNKSLNLTSISSSDLEAVFTGKKKFWDSGEKVYFAVFDDEEIQTVFFRQHVRKTSSQFKNFWTKMVFTGKANMPDYLKTLEEVMAFVSATPGGISFIPAPGGDKVKTLNIQ